MQIRNLTEKSMIVHKKMVEYGKAKQFPPEKHRKDLQKIRLRNG